jgi:hypothetical protein
VKDYIIVFKLGGENYLLNKESDGAWVPSKTSFVFFQTYESANKILNLFREYIKEEDAETKDEVLQTLKIFDLEDWLREKESV